MKKTAVVLMSLIMVMCYMPMMAFAETATDCDGGSGCSHEAAIGTTHVSYTHLDVYKRQRQNLYITIELS